MMDESGLEGFILSRQWEDAPLPATSNFPGLKNTYRPTACDDVRQLRLIIWIKTPQGPTKIIINGQEGIFFLPLSQVEQAKVLLTNLRSLKTCSWYVKELNLLSFEHEPVVGFYFAQQRGLYFARDELRKNGFEPLESDIRPTDRFLMERFVTGSLCVYGEYREDRSSQYLSDFLTFIDPKIQPTNYLPDLRVASLDIETSMHTEKLYSIAVSVETFRANNKATHTNSSNRASDENCSSESHAIVFMVGDSASKDVPCEGNNDTNTPAVNIHYCMDEKSLLKEFLQWFHEQDPDIIIGWSVVNFDLRFLQRKADALNIALNLGRNASPMQWRQARDDDQYFTLTIPGRSVLDGIDTLKSATYNFESFSLQYVASALLGRGKLIHDVDNRGEEITELFHNDKPALAAYNLEDCRLVWDIFQHTNLVRFALERANMTGLAMDRFGGSVAAFDNRYLPRLHRTGFVAPVLQKNPQGVGSPGGYVMDSQPGLYNNVLVLDFKSLYPSIIRTFKIDPLALLSASYALGESYEKTQQETCVDPKINQDDQIVPGFNGAVFDKEKSLLPDLISELWAQRDIAKQDKNAAMSQAIKILMNSFYGVLGTPGCRFFDPRLPSSITLRGHRILNKTKSLVEEQGYEVIYGDTDSLFVWLKNVEKDAPQNVLMQLGEKLAQYLNAWWQSTLLEEYSLESHLELEFETCFTQFVMPTVRGAETGSKKRYAGLKLCEDGDDEIVFKGLEAVRTDWTILAREFQRELYRRIFYQESYETFIRETVKDVYEGKCDDKLVYRKRIRRRLNDYERNVPPHVQAARIADHILREKGMPERYARGGWVQYVMTVNGPEPLEYHQSTLDYELYVERQILPIVDGIVQFMGSSFDEIAGRQMGLF